MTKSKLKPLTVCKGCKLKIMRGESYGYIAGLGKFHVKCKKITLKKIAETESFL